MTTVAVGTGANPPPLRGPLVTRTSLGADLRALGLNWGSVVLVHSSLSSLGWVAGGPVAVVQALVDVVGRHGTVVVPTHTGGNSDPAGWRNPPAPEDWWATIREELPGFHPKTAPTDMGAVAETVRTWPGAKRSDHPQVSFAAIGDRAEEFTARHKFTPALGDPSPLGRLETARAQVVLLGVGYSACTAFHLAEYRVPGAAPQVAHGGATQVDGHRRWSTWLDLDLDASDFGALGAAYEMTEEVTVGRVGTATARVFPLAGAVAFAERWLTHHRVAAR